MEPAPLAPKKNLAKQNTSVVNIQVLAKKIIIHSAIRKFDLLSDLKNPCITSIVSLVIGMGQMGGAHHHTKKTKQCWFSLKMNITFQLVRETYLLSVLLGGQSVLGLEANVAIQTGVKDVSAMFIDESR